ncbi:MAG TPA: hypothetical protein VGW34_09510 [Allosphingosinicella sp.]|nr:hypothetical protein [Allosphingosinicella sp.]
MATRTRILTEQQKLDDLRAALRTAPRRLAPHPEALVEAIRDHPLIRRWTVAVEDSDRFDFGRMRG